MRSALRAQAPSHVLQSVLGGALFKAAEAGDEPRLRELLAFELCALVDHPPPVRSRCPSSSVLPPPTPAPSGRCVFSPSTGPYLFPRRGESRNPLCGESRRRVTIRGKRPRERAQAIRRGQAQVQTAQARSVGAAGLVHAVRQLAAAILWERRKSVNFLASVGGCSSGTVLRAFFRPSRALRQFRQLVSSCQISLVTGTGKGPNWTEH